MRVLILGATGGTGKALIGQASERRADLADFLLSELERGTHTHHIVGITGWRKGWA